LCPNEVDAEQRYELLTEPPRHRHYCIGYAAPGDADFFREVLDGLERASAHRIALTVVNNHFKPAVALKNARALVRGGVQLAIEFQLDAPIAPELSAIYREARIAVIVVDSPMPGATYFGANNYQAGVLAGSGRSTPARVRGYSTMRFSESGNTFARVSRSASSLPLRTSRLRSASPGRFKKPAGMTAAP